MPGLPSRRDLLVQSSTIGALALLSGCPRPAQVLEVAPAELLVGTGLTEADLHAALRRLRAAGLSEGELFIQRRHSREASFGSGLPSLHETRSGGLALRVLDGDTEKDIAIGRLNLETLQKLLERLGVDSEAALEPTDPGGATALFSGEDHPGTTRSPDTSDIAALHLAVASELGTGIQLTSTTLVVDDSVVVVTLDGRVHRRVTTLARIDATASTDERTVTIREHLFDLLGVDSQDARAQLADRLRTRLVAPLAAPPPGPIALVLHAGGAAAWVAACEQGVLEGRSLIYGGVDDSGHSPNNNVHNPAAPLTRFRAHFDADLVHHPRSLTLSAESPQSTDRILASFHTGLQVVRLADVERSGDGLTARVAQGWWHQPDQPLATVPSHTRVWLPLVGGVEAFGNDPTADHLDTIELRPHTPVLDAAHPTVLFSGARVEPPDA